MNLQMAMSKHEKLKEIFIWNVGGDTTFVMGRQDENNMSPQEGWRHNINILCTTVYNFRVNKTSLYFSIYCPSNANIFIYSKNQSNFQYADGNVIFQCRMCQSLSLDYGYVRLIISLCYKNWVVIPYWQNVRK